MKKDVCTCYVGYQGNDCSERTCYFGVAHVDTPKGDLNSDGTVSGPLTTVITGSELYPWGTTEQYPNADANEGHFYMECSNRGLCKREDGLCECFDGYEGAACNRKSCPNDCSGHGTCESIKELAATKGFDTREQHTSAQQPVEHETTNLMIEESYSYNLWDADISQGCLCDPGYFGPDCSLRKCRYGTDPLFFDKKENTIVQTAIVHLGSKGANAGAIKGTFSIVFYDAFGEKYVTKGIDATRATTSSDKVRFALEQLPGGIVHTTSLDATRAQATAVDVSMASATGDVERTGAIGGGTLGGNGAGLGTRGGVNSYGPEFTITFSSNPGLLKSIEIDTRQVSNPGSADYWTAQQRVGQFQTRYTTLIDRVESLVYGSRRLTTSSDLSGWTPANTMIKIGRQEFHVDSINHYQAYLSEPYLGNTVKPSKTEIGVIVSSITDSNQDGLYDLITFSPALSSQSQVDSLVQGASVMVGGCAFRSSDWSVEIGHTTLSVETDHDCMPDILSADPDGARLYRFDTLPDNQDIFVAEDDTYVSTQKLATTRGSAEVYIVEPMLDAAGAQLFVGGYTHYLDTPVAAKFTVHSSNSGGSSALQDGTPIFVNGIGPFYVGGTVASAATQLVLDATEKNDIDYLIAGDSDISGVKWPVHKVVSDTNSISEGDVLGLNGRRYKVAAMNNVGKDCIPSYQPAALTTCTASTYVTNGQITLTEVIGGGQLVKVCSNCVSTVAGSGTSVTVSQKVSLKLGEQIAIGDYVNEDLLLTVTANTYTESCHSPDGGTTCEAVVLNGLAATCTATKDGGGVNACVYASTTDSTSIATSAGCYRGVCGGAGTAPGSISSLTGTNRKDLYKVINGINYAGVKVTEAASGQTYQYVSQCSNRGTCNSDTGLCQCYKGYSGLACDAQNMVAM